MAELSGQFGEFFIHEKIGSGADATVYKATNSRNQLVALKVFDGPLITEPDYCEVRENIRKLPDCLSNIDCPFIMDVYTYDVIEGYDVLETELLKGRTLKEIAESSTKLTSAEAATALSHVSQGLAALHKTGIASFDSANIGNIFVTENGVTKLIDIEGIEDDVAIRVEVLNWIDFVLDKILPFKMTEDFSDHIFLYPELLESDFDQLVETGLNFARDLPLIHKSDRPENRVVATGSLTPEILKFVHNLQKMENLDESDVLLQIADALDDIGEPIKSARSRGSISNVFESVIPTSNIGVADAGFNAQTPILRHGL